MEKKQIIHSDNQSVNMSVNELNQLKGVLDTIENSMASIPWYEPANPGQYDQAIQKNGDSRSLNAAIAPLLQLSAPKPEPSLSKYSLIRFFQKNIAPFFQSKETRQKKERANPADVVKALSQICMVPGGFDFLNHTIGQKNPALFNGIVEQINIDTQENQNIIRPLLMITTQNTVLQVKECLDNKYQQKNPLQKSFDQVAQNQGWDQVILTRRTQYDQSVQKHFGHMECNVVNNFGVGHAKPHGSYVTPLQNSSYSSNNKDGSKKSHKPDC